MCDHILIVLNKKERHELKVYTEKGHVQISEKEREQYQLNSYF